MVAMFISSKYEDLSPLLMRTVINKIGHGKYTVKSVLERELDILRTLEFRVGAPTMLEFIERYKT
jgi:Cyclin, N-terminal domain